jgi:hypothetical protein
MLLMLHLSIVAVHGIGAKRGTTWTAKREVEAGKPEFINWLSHETMLPNKVSHMRVLSFGYASDWFDDNVMHTSLLSIGRMLLICLLRERRVGTSSCPENHVTNVFKLGLPKTPSHICHALLWWTCYHDCQIY